jgi:hypothetical protein
MKRLLLDLLRFRYKLSFCIIFNYLTLFYQSFNCNITTFKSRAKVKHHDVYQCITWVIARLLMKLCLH